MAILRGDLKYRLTPKSIERSYARAVTAGQSTFQQRYVDNAPSEVGDRKKYRGQGTNVLETISDEDSHSTGAP
jgi:hypothetical protein